MADILSDISQDPDITLHILDNYIGSAYSPQVEVTETDTGHEVAITYDDAEDGITTKTFSVEDGEDYVLTTDDRDAIAGIVEGDLNLYVEAMQQATTAANAAEQARATAETGRATAEQARQSAETGRESAEGTRTQAEAERAESERQRAASEVSRESAETARVTAEQTRATAEQARVTAESTRATEWASLKSEVNGAVDDAQGAATSASAAAELATSAASSASAAASSATDAASSATSAATSANTAAQAASTAAASANTAASSANAAATAANSAATAAGTAADAATTAAGDATDAASAANTAAQAAQEAAKGISGAADALMGEPSESTWARRVTTGSGMARVERVQGATVVWNQLVGSDTSSVTVPSGHKYLGIIGGTTAIATSDGTAVSVTGGTDQLFDLTAMFGAGNEPSTVAEFERMFPEAYYPYSVPTLKPVRIAGIKSVGFNQLDPANARTDIFINSATGKIALGTGTQTVIAEVFPNTDYCLTYTDGNRCNIAGVDSLTPAVGDDARIIFSVSTRTSPKVFNSGDNRYIAAFIATSAMPASNICINISDPARNGEYKPYTTDSVEWETQTLRAAGSVRDELTSDELVTRVGERAYQSGDESDATVCTDGTTTYYPLTTPTTTPISPALPMTYRVEQGGTEAIIVPEGEISAAPVLTVAEGESAADLVMDALACIAAPDGPVATANHAINTYLTMQGKLYKVTTAIAVGETIAAGTNVTQTTVMAELIARTA